MTFKFTIIKSAVISVLLAFLVMLTNSSPAHAGLSTTDAGEASCTGTLGGGKLSTEQLHEMCQNYIASLKNQSNSAIKKSSTFQPGNTMYEITKDAAFLILGVLLGGSIVYRKKSTSTKSSKK